MGFFNSISKRVQNGSGSAVAVDGSHSMNKESVFASRGLVDPKNVSFNGLADAAIFPKGVRIFSHQENEALRVRAEQRKDEAASTKEGYKHLGEIIHYETEIELAHRGGQMNAAKEDLRRQQGRLEVAETLHNMRGDYANLGSRYEVAEKTGNDRVKAKIEANKGKRLVGVI